MIDLEAIAREHGYRTILDESAKGESLAERPWHIRIPCRYGFISVHGPDALAAYTGRRLMVSRLAAVAGVRVHQRGDDAIRVVFPTDRLDDVTELLQARRRKPPLSPENRAAMVARVERFRFSRRSGAPSTALEPSATPA